MPSLRKDSKYFDLIAGISVNASIPVFTLQPQSQTVDEYATATFTAAADNAISYQWSKNAANVGTDSASYAFATTAADNGAVVNVTATGAGGSSVSNNATLTVVSYEYQFDGVTQYGQLSTPIAFAAGQSFELEAKIYTIPFAEVSNDTLFSSNNSGGTLWIYIDSNNPKILRFKLNSDYRALVFAENVNGVVSARYDSATELVYATSNGQTVSTGMPAHTGATLNLIGTRGGDAFLPARVSNVKAWTGGSRSTGVIAINCAMNNKPIGSSQASIVGPSINIINYNAAGWVAI